MLTEEEYDRVSDRLRRIVKRTKAKPVTKKDWEWVKGLGPYIEYECNPRAKTQPNFITYTRKSTPGTRKDAIEKWGPKPFLATMNNSKPTNVMLIFKDEEYGYMRMFEGKTEEEARRVYDMLFSGTEDLDSIKWSRKSRSELRKRS